MTTYIYANPGQLVKIVTQTTTADGYRDDGYIPAVTSVVLPDSTLAAGYPINMTKVDTGLYSLSLQIPTGYSSLGSYIVSVYFENPAANWQTFVVNVARPFGASAAAPF